jgi:uncharacterized protein DUF1376
MSQFDQWMRFNVGDYLADTMHLTTFQHGIYIRLLMHCFKRGALPTDKHMLCTIAGVGPRVWHQHAEPVLALFYRVTEAADETVTGSPFGSLVNGVTESLRHKRIDAERERARHLAEVRSEAGLHGAQRRWGMANATPVANGDDGNSHNFATRLPHRYRFRSKGEVSPLLSPTPSKKPPLTPPASGEGGSKASAIIRKRKPDGT